MEQIVNEISEIKKSVTRTGTQYATNKKYRDPSDPGETRRGAGIWIQRGAGRNLRKGGLIGCVTSKGAQANWVPGRKYVNRDRRREETKQIDNSRAKIARDQQGVMSKGDRLLHKGRKKGGWELSTTQFHLMPKGDKKERKTQV